VSLCPPVFYSLFTACQYLTQYSLLVLCHSVHLSSTVCPLPVSTSHYTVCWFCVTMSSSLCLLRSVHCLPVPHTVPSLSFVSLCPLLSPTGCPITVTTSYYTVWRFCVTMFTALCYSLSTVCQYLTLFRLLVLCHSVHCSLLQSVHCLPVPHTVPSLSFVSLCPLLSSTVCPLTVSTSHCTVCWFCVTMSTAVNYFLSNVCHYHFLIVTRLLITLLQ
jgi:hypothetical protein